MTLLELKVDVSRVADALERIVFLLEKLVFEPPPRDVRVLQATIDDLHYVTPETTERLREEQADFAERYNVVPGSPAMAEALRMWEAEQRNLYGEKWQPPEDWRAILAAAGGGVRQSADAAEEASPSR